MLTGSCFCGRVTYGLSQALVTARCCHCSRCRKAFSGAGSAYAEIVPGSFRFLQGETEVSTHHVASHAGMMFCRHCGTTLAGLLDGAVHGVTLGSVNGDPGVAIAAHIFVDSRASWDHIGGDAPRYAEHAPPAGAASVAPSPPGEAEDIELRAVTAGNWRDCVALELDPQQAGYVSSNLFSLAQSRFETCRVPCAIYHRSDGLVGFALYNDAPLPDGTYRISRMMIDRAHQGRGHGRRAAMALIERLRGIPDCDAIWLDYAPENDVAARFWERLGFEPRGREGDNVLACLRLDGGTA